MGTSKILKQTQNEKAASPADRLWTRSEGPQLSVCVHVWTVSGTVTQGKLEGDFHVAWITISCETKLEVA